MAYEKGHAYTAKKQDFDLTKEDKKKTKLRNRRTVTESINMAKKIKEAYTIAVSGNVDSLDAWIKEVAEDNPDKAIAAMVKLTEYVLPKLTKGEMNITEEKADMDYSKLTADELDTLIELMDKCKITDEE